MTKIKRFSPLFIGVFTFTLFCVSIFTIFPSIAEPAPQSQQWTLLTLKAYYDQKFESLQVAVNKADAATEKRFESVNEFRGTLSDQQRTFLPRAEYEAGIKTTTDDILDLKTRLNKIENLKQGGSTTLAYIVSGVSLLIALIALSRNFIASIIQKPKS